MTERKLTMIPVEVDGYCDPEAGVCALPSGPLDEAPEPPEPDSD